MTTKELKQKLKKSYDIEESDIDWIICEVAGIKRSEINLLHDVPVEAEERAYTISKLRQDGQPLAYILGRAYFYGREFKVRKGCLIPRCETEELVETVLSQETEGKGLEIGVGSGAIILTIALENKKIIMQGVDISSNALKIANENAKALNADVHLKKSDVFSNVEGKFDFIVSNPPYITTADIETLDKGVKDFEPIIALDGGADGLDFYRKIIKDAPKHLNANGRLYFEVGINEAEDVAKLLENDFEKIVIKKDLEGVDRFVYASLK